MDAGPPPGTEAEFSAAFFREATEAAFVFNPVDERILHANPAAERLVRRDRKALAGLRICDLFIPTSQEGLSDPSHAGGRYLLLRPGRAPAPVRVTIRTIITPRGAYGLAMARDAEREDARRELLAAITRAQGTYLTTGDTGAAFGDLLQDLLSLTRSEYGFIGEVCEAEAGKFLQITCTDAGGSGAPAAGFELRDLNSLPGRVLTTGAPVIANDPAADPRPAGLPPGLPPLRAFLGLPFSHAGRVVGIVGLANRAGGYDPLVAEYVRPLLATCANIAAAYRTRREREAAETALRVSEARHRALLAGLPDLIFIFGPDGAYRDFYAGDPSKLLVTPDQFLGKHPRDVLPPDITALVANAFARSAATGGTETIHYELPIGGGPTFFEARVVSCGPDGWLSVVRDVTDKKRDEERLRQMSQRLMLATDAAGVGIWDWDLTTDRLLWDDRMCQIYGIRPEDFTHDSAAWRRYVLPDDLARMEADGWRSPAAAGVAEYQYRIVRPDGAVRVIRARSVAQRDAGGRPVRMIGTNWDVTERVEAEDRLRASEARFRLLADATADVISLHDPDGICLYTSPSQHALTGHHPEELVGRPAWERVHLDDAEGVRQAAAKNARGETAQFEFRARRRDGLYVWVEATARPVLGEGRKLLHVVCCTRDISARKRLEQQFFQAQKMEAVGQLAGGVAHDFNNLLTVINGFADLLLATTPDEEAREALQEIARAGARAADLTRQLLAFSRRAIMTTKVVNLNDVLAHTTKMLRRLIGEDIELVTRPAPDLGAVRIDPGQLEQVIVNLAVNARDAMSQGGRLTIETRNVELAGLHTDGSVELRPGQYVLLSVSDTGVGMAEGTKARIFEPFFTTKEVGKGTGLGLATVYGIVRQSDGHIAVETAPGRGSCFRVYLPMVDGVPAERLAGPGSPPRVPRGEEVILVAEDDESVRRMTVTALRSAGYQVLEACDGVDAEELFGQTRGRIDLLITDIVMPRMRGGELAMRLRAGAPELKVLFVSGYSDDEFLRRGLRDHELVFLRKPFSPSELARKVRDLLDGRA
ncbi:MAG TPA: PAS domain-containing protein [Gemmataceae bacterium]|nr:PAS domain-containing protein [Gemmataceae bacterium]